MGEFVEFLDGGAALDAQRVGLVEDRRDPPLLGEGREKNLVSFDIRRLDEWLRRPRAMPSSLVIELIPKKLRIDATSIWKD